MGEGIPHLRPVSGRRRHWEQQWGSSLGWLGRSCATCQGQLRALSLLPSNLTHFPTTIRAIFSGLSPSLPPSPAWYYVLYAAQFIAILCYIPRVLCTLETPRTNHTLWLLVFCSITCGSNPYQAHFSLAQIWEAGYSWLMQKLPLGGIYLAENCLWSQYKDICVTNAVSANPRL